MGVKNLSKKKSLYNLSKHTHLKNWNESLLNVKKQKKCRDFVWVTLTEATKNHQVRYASDHKKKGSCVFVWIHTKRGEKKLMYLQ